jgi:hypothetical protein
MHRWPHHDGAGGSRGVAQLGSALRSGRRGRRFKSCHPDCIAAGQRPAPEMVRASLLPVQQQNTASTATTTRSDLSVGGLHLACSALRAGHETAGSIPVISIRVPARRSCRSVRQRRSRGRQLPQPSRDRQASTTAELATNLKTRATGSARRARTVPATDRSGGRAASEGTY